MKRIINEANHSVKDAVEGPEVCISRDEVVHALNEKGKNPGYSHVPLQ